jgi:hypothetical protein
MHADAIALSSVTVSNGKETTVVIGGDDSVVEAAASKGLYGAYHNILTKAGVAALWNGFVGSSSSAKAYGALPAIIAGGKTASALTPVNMVFPATKIVFFDKDARGSSISEEDAVKR